MTLDSYIFCNPLHFYPRARVQCTYKKLKLGTIIMIIITRKIEEYFRVGLQIDL